MKLSSGQTITSQSTDTVVTFNSENYDTDSCFDTSTYRFTPNKEGYYLFSGFLYVNNYSSTAAQLGTVRILKNGSIQQGVWRGTGSYDNGAGYDNPGYSLSSVILYANGTTDYFQLEVAFEGSTRVISSLATVFNGVYVRGA